VHTEGEAPSAFPLGTALGRSVQTVQLLMVDPKGRIWCLACAVLQTQERGEILSTNDSRAV